MSLERRNEVVTAGSFRAELVWLKRVRASDGNIYDVLYFRGENEGESHYLTACRKRIRVSCLLSC